MLGIGLNILGEVAKTAAFGAVTGKVIDSVVSSKLNKKNDHDKWLRETKLDFYTKLSQEILNYDLKDSSADEERALKEICSKTILVIDNKTLIFKIENYLNELNKAKRALIYKENAKPELFNDFKAKSLDLIIALNNNLKKG